MHASGHAAGDTERIVEGLKGAGKKAALVLNKIDGMKRETLLPLADRLNKSGIFDRTFMISATKGDGLDELAAYCAGLMPEGPFLYPEDQAADIPSRLLAAEITREKLYLRLHDELPYASTVSTESWTDNKDGSVRIDQTIFVMRESQKGIVIGKGGQTIKSIGEAARLDMEQVFDRRVHLFSTPRSPRAGEKRPPIIANGAWNSRRINELRNYPQATREICSRFVSLWISGRAHGMV